MPTNLKCSLRCICVYVSPMTKAPKTHRKKQKMQCDITKTSTKNFDYTMIADRLRTISWGKDSHLSGVVIPVYGSQTFPLTAKAV